MVEQAPVKGKVVGSSPTCGAKFSMGSESRPRSIDLQPQISTSDILLL